MCTVIFLPTPNGVLLSSNRDESPLRPTAKPPDMAYYAQSSIICPTDILGGGTWAGVNRWGSVVVLLNGAFNKPPPADKRYRSSRGLIVKELLCYARPLVRWQHLYLRDIAPFTLIIWSEESLYQCVWDGIAQHTLLCSTQQAHIWSSVTLYTPQAHAVRQQYFQQWLFEQPIRNKDTLLAFLYSYSDPENGFVMNRNNNVKTLSISVIEQNGQTTSYYYCDLITSTTTLQTFSFLP